ncbi:hypothetical protein SAMN00790413_00534 [Deinococcus hopiensis KR-140]|uniref:Uncharacterized protein n=1 Tax=Deinococcus hopiensis KR-140 TaxID=695939 RepID=A0A1W1V9S3_9DEIO|nr:hypothetical protein SAMN00790413_00534 [Deinococcus hopiensis KR-140]
MVGRAVRGSGLRAYRVRRREQRFFGVQPAPEASGFDVKVSGAGPQEVERQIADALALLETPEQALSLSASYRGVKEAILELTGGHETVWIQGDRTAFTSENHFSPSSPAMELFGPGCGVYVP